MNFTECQYWTHQILSEAVWEAKYVLVVGSGIWFEGLEGQVLYALEGSYDLFLSSAMVIPALGASFCNGGRIQFVDFGPVSRGLSELSGVPDVVYLVEDAPGVNFDSWNNLVEPLLRGTVCPVVLLGEACA